MTEAINPLISTIIPTYRRPVLLRRAIASALEQRGVDVRVCVFDNCSGDETAEVVHGMAQEHVRIRYHCHAHNIGGGANFDFAMRSVDTPFFSLLSDDDYLLPGFYQRALAALAENPEAMFWVGETLCVDERGAIWDARVNSWSREGVFNPPEGLMAMMHGRAPTWTGVFSPISISEESARRSTAWAPACVTASASSGRSSRPKIALNGAFGWDS